MGDKGDKSGKSEVITSATLRGWIDGRETHRIKRGQGAATSDRAHRAAWPNMPLKSAYAHLLTFPAHLPAAAHREAALIHDRILEVMEKGGWTGAEWNRLHNMERAWGRRAEGKDAKFNVMGWNRKGDGRHTPEIVKMMERIRREIEDDGKQGD